MPTSATRLCALACCALIAAHPSVPFASQQYSAPLDLNLPSLGTVAGADLSVIEERLFGEEIMKTVREDKRYMTDPETTDYINRLGYRLVAAGASQPFNFFFFPIRDKSLNAFALPGGFIAVHSGLVISAKSESELAGVIGHEIGHVTQRHIARTLTQGQSSLAMTIGSILLALLAARAGGNSGGDAAMAIAMGSQAAMIQKQLAYSRDAEREADRVGFATLVNAGFDPKGMEAFFARLQQNNRNYESASTAYLSTHPLSGERMTDMQNRTIHMQPREHRDSLDFLLVQARLRVLQETRYDGWLDTCRYFRHELKTAAGEKAAAAHYGLSIALSRMNKPGEAVIHARKASELAKTRSVIIDKNLSEAIYLAAHGDKEKENALSISEETAKRHPYSALAASNHAELLFRSGKNEQVIKFLRNQEALGKSDPDYHAFLARSYESLGRMAESFAATGDMYALLGNHRAALYQFDLAQKAADADFYVMSEIDAKLRRERDIVLDTENSKN